MTEMIDMTGNGDFVPAAPSAQQAASIVPSTVAGMALGDGLGEQTKKLISDANIEGVGLRILARNCNILGNGTTIETYSRNGETYLVLDGWNCVAPGGTAQPAPILSATVETWEDRMSRSGRRECESLAIELMQAEIADWRALVAPPAQPITPELNEPTAALVEQLNNYAGNSGYSHGDYADTMKQAAHCIGQLVGCVELYQRKYAESCARELAAQPIADVSASTDERAAFDKARATGQFRPVTEQCPIWYATQLRWEGWEMHAAEAYARAAAPVSGQAASIRYDAQFSALVLNYMISGGVGAEGKRTFDALVQHIDSRPRSEDSRAEVLGAVENIVLQQCTGMAAKDIRLSRILAAIRALATTAAPERSGQAAQEQAAPALTDADRLLIVAFIHREMVDTVRAHGEVACARFLNKWQTPAELDKKLVAHLYADTQAKGGAA